MMSTDVNHVIPTAPDAPRRWGPFGIATSDMASIPTT